MRPLARVVWHEGMHLSQHHFQAQSRYFEELVSFVASSLVFRPYGVTACEFDAEALRNDTVSLVRARGIMPDGLAFSFPSDSLPEPREVRSLFSPTQDRHEVLLAIRAFEEGHASVSIDAGGGPTRYRADEEMVLDEVTGLDRKGVPLGRKSFRLLLDTEDSEGWVTLPLARIRRDGTGHFVYDEEFIPPCLQIGASPQLVALLGRVVDLLGARADALAAERAEGAAGVVQHWLQHALHAGLAPLLHLQRTRQAHPSDLFEELSRLAGALCTFSLDAHARDLPLYDHDRPGTCFGALERRIRDLLGVALPTTSVRMPLRPQGESYFTAEVDARCLGPARWYLGVRSSAGPAETAARVPRLVKVCSAKHIQRLVREAFPGLPVEHVLSPPPEISPRGGTEYFFLPREGPCWLSIVETRAVGVYAPAAIPGVELELVAALDA